MYSFSDQKFQKVAKLQEKGPKHLLITISTSWLRTDPSKIVLWVNHRISKSSGVVDKELFRQSVVLSSVLMYKRNLTKQ